MEKVDLDELENLYFPHTGIIHYFGDADLSYLNPILKAVPEMIAELKLLRSENEKLRKVCEAARDVSDVMSRLVKYIEDENDYEELREVLSNLEKELGGENGTYASK